MRNVHDFKVTENEFFGYFFNFRKSLIINKSKKVEVGDYARLFEVNAENNEGTGRNLLFEILKMGKIKGIHKTKNVHYIDLKKVETE